MKKANTALDLRFVGDAEEVVLGTFSVGVDIYSEMVDIDMEFAGDHSDLTA